MVKSKSLQLDVPIVTGNTKAAVKAAGGGSSDLWTVPPSAIFYDPRDNVRPLDQARVRHIADLIRVNGYDRKKPLGCIVRKVDGEDRIYVYEGQHRYHAALLVISEGISIERLPIVIDEAKSVSRENLIVAGVTNNDGEKLSPLDLASAVVELQQLNITQKVICARLGITDQTIRDVTLLATAPAAIHDLIRSKVVSSTLAIEEIRTYGGDKAMFRLTSAAAQAKATGTGKITKKALPKPATKGITGEQAKQLLQALQSVLHDPLFGKLSPGTVAGVHSALTPLSDLLDALPKKSAYPIHHPNKHGVFDKCEVIRAPMSKRTGLSPAEIHLAQPEDGSWIFSTTLRIGNSGTSGVPSIRDFEFACPTRMQAIRAAVSELTRALDTPERRIEKDAKAVHTWLNKLHLMPDPDWSEELSAKYAEENA
ncbi:transcriptional regulator [Caballeronia sp. dw_276]|uniref:transcriptional regulator n=1 Tax=Caballeronia sp. dw_276 TaxID=2719795 RepID=UPI001BD357E3|nr:transcriptional regulator [Caballeronia sp. dw_276]